MLDVTSWAQVRGHEVFRDHAKPDLFWVLPGTLEVLKAEDGEAVLSLLLHRGGDAPSGGMLTATFVVATSSEQRALIADDLRRMTGRRVEVRAVELAEVEVFLDGEAPTSIGRGRVSPQGHLVANAALTAELAEAAEAALAAGQGLGARAQFEVAGHRPGLQGQMTVDFSRAATVWPGGDALDALAVRAGFDRMLEERMVEVQAAGDFARVMDGARAWITDLFLDPVGVGQWRAKAVPAESPGRVTYDLGQGASFVVRGAVAADLATQVPPPPGATEGTSTTRVDIDADDFFRETELQLEIVGDFEAHQVHAVIVEVRGGDHFRSELFEEPTSTTLRFPGRVELEMQTRVMLRSSTGVLGHRRGELESPWRPVSGQIATAAVEELAPLWNVELSSTVDWEEVHHIQVTARYADPAHELDDRTTFVMKAAEPTVTLSVRPRDPSVNEVVIEARFLREGGQSERTFRVRAPGPLVLEP